MNYPTIIFALIGFRRSIFPGASRVRFLIRLLPVAWFAIMQAVSSAQAADQEVSFYPSHYTWIEKEAQVYLHVRGSGMRPGFAFVVQNGSTSQSNVYGRQADGDGNVNIDEPNPRLTAYDQVNSNHWRDYRCQYAGYADGA